MGTENEPLPKSVWQGSFRLFGVDIRCHVLDNGKRIIEAESFAALLSAFEAADDEQISSDEVERFAKWMADK